MAIGHARPTHRAAEALSKVRPELEQIAPEDFRRIRVDLLDAVGRAIQVAEQAESDRPLFEEIFRHFPLWTIDQLGTYAMALWQAETEYRRCQVEGKARRIPPAALVEKCRALREELVAAARYVFRRDEEASEVLLDITRSTGYRDLADDLNRLAELFTARWEDAGQKSEIKKADLKRAAERGAELMRIVSLDVGADLAAWARLRQQAWTLLHRTYQKIRDGAAYIHSEKPERMSSYPSLFAQGAG